MSSPAPCSGTSDTWNFCFYLSQYSSYARVAELSIYRMNKNFTRYDKVLESALYISLAGDNLFSDYICRSIQTSHYFDVTQGDIIGACMTEDPNNRVFPLDMVTMQSDGELYERVNSEACVGNLNVADIGVAGMWNIVPGRALHIYLNVSELFYHCRYHINNSIK